MGMALDKRLLWMDGPLSARLVLVYTRVGFCISLWFEMRCNDTFVWIWIYKLTDGLEHIVLASAIRSPTSKFYPL